MAADEIWLPVVGYEGLYEVSDQGNVRALKWGRWHNRQKLLQPQKTGSGYLQVWLCKDDIRKYMKVHRLVAQAFIPNPLNLPQVNHRDENKLNNAASNLEWMTNKDNTTYSCGRPVQMLDKATCELLETFPSLAEAHRVTGIRYISACCRGKCKSAGGFKWRYAGEA